MESCASEFYHEVVAPTVSDFLNRPHDRRLACLACLCLSSMAVHYIHAVAEPAKISKEISSFWTAVRAENWAVGQVHDIANATKHVIRRGPGVGYGDVSSQQIVVGNLRAGWPFAGMQVMVEVEPGNVWLVKDLVEAANQWWRDKLTLPIKEA